MTEEDKVLLSDAGREIVKAQGFAEKTVFEVFTKPVMERSNAGLLGFCEAELGKVKGLVGFWRNVTSFSYKTEAKYYPVVAIS